MATFADLFNTRYLTGGSTVEFSSIRLHYGALTGSAAPSGPPR